MGKINVSDLIENYIKQLLQDDTQLDIQRSEIAEHFHCVPSQINYVIKTRFTISKGYRVESKRGGGGYIRITKLYVQPHKDRLMSLSESLNDVLSFEEARNVIQQLLDWEYITQREADLILSMTSPNILEDTCNHCQIRSNMMKKCLERLSYEVKE